MTLLLTHVSSIGIVMATDSAITFINQDGSIRNVDQKGWQKLFYIPILNAGVSYWGAIGQIRRRFDLWIEYLIRANASKYVSVSAFASFLSQQMNDAARNVVLNDPIGVHLAGFESWDDGLIRPVFLHIHNGNGHYQTQIMSDNPIQLRHYWHRTEAPKLFQVHQDFPFPGDLVGSLAVYANGGRITRNGDFYMYAQIANVMDEAISLLNTNQMISIPSRPHQIQSWKGYWHVMLQNIINIYRISNLHPTVGGKVSSIAFDQSRAYLN